MRINCPHCGERSSEEFSMLGDASKVRPTSSELTEEWHDYVYLRRNSKGRVEEYWHHVGGCRSWLVVERNTISHEVYSVVTAIGHTISRQKASKNNLIKKSRP